MGSSGPKPSKNEPEFLPILLLSLTKSEDIRNYLKNIDIKNKEDFELLNIFNDISNYKSIDDLSKKFQELFDKDISPFNIKKFYKFTINEMDKELKDNNNGENSNINDEANVDTLISQINNDKKKDLQNKDISFIEDLFYSKQETITICSNCKDKKKSLKNKLKIFSSNNPLNQNLNVIDLLNKKNKEIKMKCEKCGIYTYHLKETIIIKYPKIIIIFNKVRIKINFNYIENINNEEYHSINYIINSEEMYYKRYENYYRYNITNKKNKRVNLNEIVHVYPIIIFYRKKDDIKNEIDNSKLNSFFKGKNYPSAILDYINYKKYIRNLKEKEEIKKF